MKMVKSLLLIPYEGISTDTIIEGNGGITRDPFHGISPGGGEGIGTEEGG